MWFNLGGEFICILADQNICTALRPKKFVKLFGFVGVVDPIKSLNRQENNCGLHSD